MPDDRTPECTDLERELQRQIKELSTLYEVSKVLTAALDLDESLRLIVETAARMMGVKACGLRLLDKTSGEMVLRAVYGLSQEYIQKGRVFLWTGLYKDVIVGGEVAVIDHVAADPRIEYTEEAITEGIASMLSVGLRIRNETIGALSVYTAESHDFTEDQIRIFKGIANEAAAVIEKAMLYEERMESQRIEQELAAAGRIQVYLMPRESPKVRGYQIAARNIPARTVGGDFYDFISFDESHLGIVIADVSGKGVPGAILMASARATLRAYLEEPHRVEWVIRKLNNVLHRDTRSDQFVSLFYGMLDTQDQTFTYVNAGHNPPVLLRNAGKIPLREGGPILGVLPDALYESRKAQLLTGDIIILYTDGITEAEQNGEYFGEERLLELVQADLSRSPEKITKTVLDKVAELSADVPQADDRTIIVLKRE